jgi:5-methyltetrahydrofolate--homocysteine methyltransferase
MTAPAERSLPGALASGRLLLMDGAMGTRLQAAGLGMGECGPLWNLTRAAQVARVHQEYLAAGAQVLLTNTFQANPVALARYGLEGQLEEINARAVQLARRAAGGPRFVLGDIGPILRPGRYEEFAERAALRQVIESLEGVDGLLFETCSSPAALAAVEFALHRVGLAGEVPLLLSLTYLVVDGEPVTFSRHRPETFARHAARHGVAALGVNCGKDIDLATTAAILRRYRGETDLPLFARPNAGAPRPDGSYPLGPAEFAAGLPDLVEAGARMVGGCCGTTPEHIRQGACVLRADPLP